MHKHYSLKLIFIFLSRNCLLQTIKHCYQILEFVKLKNVEVKFHGRGKNEASHYCGQCEVRDLTVWIKTRILINFLPDRSFQHPFRARAREAPRRTLHGLRSKAIA